MTNSGYQDTIKRLEPDIHAVDAGAYYASAAISLKRIADTLEEMLIMQQQALERKREGLDL